MDGLESLVLAGGVGLVVGLLGLVLWVMAIVAFFSMAIKVSKISQDVRELRQIAQTEHEWALAQQQQVHQPPTQQP